jgi:hypothetical protein
LMKDSGAFVIFPTSNREGLPRRLPEVDRPKHDTYT